jgi:S-ribosylhomocysteine lyase LuxS involved in autoinducer biosynthesis
MGSFDGAIPGASAEECGNYLDQDLKGCNAEAAAYLKVLRGLTAADMRYSYYLE